MIRRTAQAHDDGAQDDVRMELIFATKASGLWPLVRFVRGLSRSRRESHPSSSQSPRTEIQEKRPKNFNCLTRRCSDYKEIRQTYGSVEDLLKNADVDAVSIVTPDAFPMPVALACLKAGKHVLCEKPLALNHADAKKMVAAAKKDGVIHMVNFSYRDWPCIQDAAATVRRGEIGAVVHVEASDLQSWLTAEGWKTYPPLLWPPFLPFTVARACWTMSACILWTTPPTRWDP